MYMYLSMIEVRIRFFFSFKGLKEDKELKNIFYKIRLDGEESDVLLFFINRSDNVIFLDVMLKIFC